ncbi:hypothetical protein JB92DRAFT_3032249 [Gautieria morchelliformis]|nr:hypothetical protein JB92DRAFT_3032249 [Gautieria morchelliformis]
MTLVRPQFRVGPFQSFAMPSTTTDNARSRALDATSTDPWGPSHSLMEELRAYTQTRDCADILHVLHDALTSNGPHWRRVLKALITISHCIRSGSKEVMHFATAHKALIRQLTRFEYMDTYRLDRGAAVRAEAEELVNMLQSPRGQESRNMFVRHPARDGPAPRQSTSSSSSPAPTKLFILSPMDSLSLQPPRPTPHDIAQEPFRDSTTLSTLISHVESSDSNAISSEDIWLNIYKLLFLLNVNLSTASNDVIYHWTRHTHLLKRLVGRHQPLRESAARHPEESVASEVRRLAAELVRIFDGASGPKEVRRRARMF